MTDGCLAAKSVENSDKLRAFCFRNKTSQANSFHSRLFSTPGAPTSIKQAGESQTVAARRAVIGAIPTGKVNRSVG